MYFQIQFTIQLTLIQIITNQIAYNYNLSYNSLLNNLNFETTVLIPDQLKYIILN